MMERPLPIWVTRTLVPGGQQLVGRRHGVLIVGFAVGGGFAVKAGAVPGGRAFFHKPLADLRG